MVSLASTSIVQVLEQPLLMTFKVNVKVVSQGLPARTVAVCPVTEPEREPLPAIDQE